MGVRRRLWTKSRICLAISAAVLVVVVPLMSVQSAWASPSPSPSPGAVTLHLGWTEDPDNLNLFVGYQSSCYEIWALNYSYLFGTGEQNQPILDLASEFPTQQNGGIADGGRIWTIHIKSGVKWQDGVPLTASDVSFTYNYIIKNSLVNYLNYVDGIERAKALNATTVQLVCAHPMAVGYMETQSVPIVPEHIWAHVSGQAATTTYGSRPPIIGSGPFETGPTSRAATSRWSGTPTTTARSRPSTASTSRTTRIPTPWSAIWTPVRSTGRPASW